MITYWFKDIELHKKKYIFEKTGYVYNCLLFLIMISTL